jgi:hypothetical protein
MHNRNIVNLNILSRQTIIFFIIHCVFIIIFTNDQYRELIFFSPGLLVSVFFTRLLFHYEPNYLTDQPKYFLLFCNIIFLVGFQFILTGAKQLKTLIREKVDRYRYIVDFSDCLGLIIVLCNIIIIYFLFYHAEGIFSFNFSAFYAWFFSFLVYYYIYILFASVLKIIFCTYLSLITFTAIISKKIITTTLKSLLYMLMSYIFGFIMGKIGNFINLIIADFTKG